MANKHPLRLALAILITLLVSCGKPGEVTINVNRTTGGIWLDDPVKTEATAIRVKDLEWRKKGGLWVGDPGMWRPADTNAVEAIDEYMKLFED